MIFNMTGGGSAGEPVSSILVTAPAGSTVTVCAGNVTKTAREVAGIWTFPGCGLGIWTVNAVSPDEAQRASAVVNIQEEGQLLRYPVHITYFEAVITVTYPAGSVCTAALEDTLLTAPDTTGTAAFTVPKAGNWVIRCHNGLKEAEQTISITGNGQHETVTMDYYFYVLKDGVLHSDVGSLQNVYGCSFTDGVIRCVRDDTHDNGSYFTKKIDTTNYSVLKFYLSQSNIFSNAYATRVGFMSKTISGSTVYDANKNYFVACTSVSDISGERKLYSVDLSGINGQYYLSFLACGSFTVDAMWLE